MTTKHSSGDTGNSIGAVARRLPPSGRGTSGLRLGFSVPLAAGAFEAAVRRIVAQLVEAGGADDVVFPVGLSDHQQKVIAAAAMKRQLRCRKETDPAGDVCLVVGVERSPIDTVKLLLQHGGDSNRYRLLKPSSQLCSSSAFAI